MAYINYLTSCLSTPPELSSTLHLTSPAVKNSTVDIFQAYNHIPTSSEPLQIDLNQFIMKNLPSISVLLGLASSAFALPAPQGNPICYTTFTITTSYPLTKTEFRVIAPVISTVDCHGCEITFTTVINGPSQAPVATTTIDTPHRTIVPICKDGDADDKAIAGAAKLPGGVAAALPEPPKSPLAAIPGIGGLLGGGGKSGGKSGGGLLGLPLPIKKH
ncbi:hypothetical protein TWF694_008279 [Orbilia ellipsospora]|uniref:Uncharacterized protein n=1 Tax=Orbilia ellipsospora TaxID=2528407 RepID=A0AAV9XFL9_9PEZI